MLAKINLEKKSVSTQSNPKRTTRWVDDLGEAQTGRLVQASPDTRLDNNSETDFPTDVSTIISEMRPRLGPSPEARLQNNSAAESQNSFQKSFPRLGTVRAPSLCPVSFCLASRLVRLASRFVCLAPRFVSCYTSNNFLARWLSQWTVVLSPPWKYPQVTKELFPFSVSSLRRN